MGNRAGCGCSKGLQAKEAAAPINPSTNNKDAADQFEANNNNQHLVQPPHPQKISDSLVLNLFKNPKP